MPTPDPPQAVSPTAHAGPPVAVSQRRPNAADYAARDLAVLRFTLRYGLALNCTVSAAIFKGLECGHVLRKLSDRGWLERFSSVLPGGLSYFRLTPKGGKQIGVEVKPRKLGAVALGSAIGSSYFCTVDGGSLRLPISPKELTSVNSAFPGNVPHVVTDELGEPAVLRVQFAASGKAREVKKKATDFIRKSRADARLSPWVASGQLGLAVLGHTPERVNELSQAFEGDDRFSDVPVLVGLGPTSETLVDCLRILRASNRE